jgi:hypothetical protein
LETLEALEALALCGPFVLSTPNSPSLTTILCPSTAQFFIHTSTLQLHTKRRHRLLAFASYLQQNKHKYLRPAHIVSFPIGSLLTLSIASRPYNEVFANLALRLPRHIECYRVGAIREQCARSSRSTRRKRPAI